MIKIHKIISQKRIILFSGSSTIDNLVDIIEYVSPNRIIALALSTSGRCNLSCVGPIRQGEDVVPEYI
jgi:hypothetical protein